MEPRSHLRNLTLLLAFATGCALASKADAGIDLIDQAQPGNLNVLDTQVGRVQDKRSRARVVANDIRQEPRGDNSVMRLHIGNALEGGRSDVTADRLKQSQRGSGGVQKMLIGTAHTGSTLVVARDLSQSQKGDNLAQSASIGLAGYAASSRTEVTANAIKQMQFGRGLEQTLSIGNALTGGKARVNASNITQTQSGEDSTLSLTIGDATDGAVKLPAGR